MPATKLPPAKVPEEIILEKIYGIRGMKGMPDKDLAEMYGVEVRVINQVQVNIQNTVVYKNEASNTG